VREREVGDDDRVLLKLVVIFAFHCGKDEVLHVGRLVDGDHERLIGLYHVVLEPRLTDVAFDAVHPVDGARILFVRADKVEHFLLPGEPLGSWELLGGGRGQHNLTSQPNL
jgi:hypothetical protein